ncbi:MULTISPECIES: lysine--tRNA ligase [Dethiosulfovibrio]|uniref:Lysine--tRNA ligase n=2 Tax=Dethiosulfovibrio TaxID=47054 RepID=A0ABS9ENF9_9BACT|nr:MULTISPECIES: lysine--tRNA ligase [Dethiosulfovibrio]MCF4113776.1 lysine--tRNA ligase [Dethiosulfovibrio russensis]MCF4141811.1 lysine--tRNA ligase [Dethiosulfovibrio marinus]MCF4143771.1 lysine--tRNA ligase [Dethiosulfovibrio acidaminovorans]
MSDMERGSLTPEEEILSQRMDKLRRLREEEGYDPYVNESWEVEQTLVEVRRDHDDIVVDESREDVSLSVAGRLMTVRKQGKASFANMQDETGSMQLYFRLDSMGEDPYRFFKKWIDAGDIIGVEGHPFRTRRGELTIAVTRCVLLSKALRPLPEKWHGLTDTEVRYRKRYVDLMVNPEVRDVFRQRARIISSVRKTLEDHGTLEVDTPILSYLAGGANARPFVTHHNALDLDMYLRIATELHLKRLVVGMMGRVYEMGKNFRNEGMDAMHNPEFTCMEVYWPYSDYVDMMDLTEEIARKAAIDATGSTTVTWQGTELDLGKPFRRATMVELVKEHCGVDFDGIDDDNEARRIAEGEGLALEGDESRFKVLTMMVEEFVEEHLVQPTFVMGHPTEISPLSKRNPDKPDYTHRFELFVCGSEVANGFSELNDPIDQRARFEDQAKLKAAGDEEGHPFDEDFVNALEQGLPPTGGLGIGIDRLIMFLTDSRSIRDVILFPTMKPKA